MRLLPFGTCVDGALLKVLVGLLSLKMFGSGTKRWFVRKQKREQQQQRACRRPCSRRKKRRAARILKRHRETMLSELDVGAVLPRLVYDKVFSLGEYKEILGQESSQKRTEIFLERLSSKGPAAFCSFCSVLEEVCPHLLTSFLLDGEGTAIRKLLISLTCSRGRGEPPLAALLPIIRPQNICTELEKHTTTNRGQKDFAVSQRCRLRTSKK